MKLIISVIFGILIIPSVISQERLLSKFKDIIDLAPIDQISKIYEKYNTGNEAFQEYMKFTQSKEMYESVKKILHNPEYLKMTKYLKETTGLSIPDESVDNFIDQHIKEALPCNSTVNGGRVVNELVEEIFATLPKDDIIDLIKKKMDTVPEVKTFMESIHSPEYAKLHEDFYNSPDLQDVWALLKSKGFDQAAMYAFLQSFISSAYE